MAENNKKPGVANKAVYFTIVAVLCVIAAAVTLPGMISQRRGEGAARDSVTAETSGSGAASHGTTAPGTTDGETVRTPRDTAVADRGSDEKLTTYPETQDGTEAKELPEPKKQSATGAVGALDDDDGEADAEVGAHASVPDVPELAAPVSGAMSHAHSDSVLVYSMTMNDYRTHLGIDIEAPLGEPVAAAADGIIGEVWSDPMMGACVSVVHTGDAVTVYKNLDPQSTKALSAGMPVNCGDIIGAVGESAAVEIASEPHLHFELCVAGVSVDPAERLELPVSTVSD